MISAIIIPITFGVMIFLWLYNKPDQMLVSLGGAIVAIISLIFIDGQPFSIVVDILFGTEANGFINFHSLLLSLGMLFVISVCQETGVFNYLAFKVVQRTGGHRFQLMFILCSLSFLFTAVLNNILAVYIFNLHSFFCYELHSDFPSNCYIR